MTHWKTTFDPDDGEPIGALCDCDIDADHDGKGNLIDPDPAPSPSRETGASGCSNPPEESCSDAGCPVHGDRDNDWDYAGQQEREGLTGMAWDNLGSGGCVQ